MRRPLALVSGLALAAALLAGCGDDTSGGEADDEPRGRIDFTLAEIVDETAVGGMVSPGAIALADETAVIQLAAQFDDEDRMSTRLLQAFDELDVPDDQAAYAAVVAIGCTPPTDVVVTSTDTGILIEPDRESVAPSSDVECLAAITSVAIVLVDEAVVG